MLEGRHPSYYGLPDEAELISWRGADSEVWFSKGYAVKIYPHFTKGQIRQYQQITKQAEIWLKQNNFNFAFDDHSFQISQVVSLKEVKEIIVSDAEEIPSKRYITASSDYIVGPNGNDLANFDIGSLNKAISSLSEDEQVRLSHLSSKIFQNKLASGLFDTYLQELSIELEESLKYKGLRLIPFNLKFRMPEDFKVQCIVTDLTPRIKEIKSSKILF